MASSLNWSPPPLGPSIDPGEVHLWWIDARSPGLECAAWLAPDEWARAQRLRDASRFIRFRCGLRAALAAYLQADPAALRFGYGGQGKPQLLHSDTPLAFNLAHCGDQGLLAVRLGADLGVDLERVRPFPNALAIARRQLGETSADALSRLLEPARTEHFFEQWACMEARIKTRGGSVFGAVDTELDCAGFIPRAGWRAALASPLPLPPPAAWRGYAIADLAWREGPHRPTSRQPLG